MCLVEKLKDQINQKVIVMMMMRIIIKGIIPPLDVIVDILVYVFAKYFYAYCIYESGIIYRALSMYQAYYQTLEMNDLLQSPNSLQGYVLHLTDEGAGAQES